MYFEDVRAMLALPRPDIGIDAGCNFALIEVLCAVISGLSRVFRTDIAGAGRAFREVLALYPHDAEPPGAIVGPAFQEELWEGYRCNLTHSLGINAPDPERGTQRTIQARARPTKIVRAKAGGLGRAQIDQIEDIAQRPTWLGPTLWIGLDRQYLCADALYWGTRVLVARLCADPDCVARADAFLAPGEAIAEQATQESISRLLGHPEKSGTRKD